MKVLRKEKSSASNKTVHRKLHIKVVTMVFTRRMEYRCVALMDRMETESVMRYYKQRYIYITFRMLQ